MKKKEKKKSEIQVVKNSATGDDQDDKDDRVGPVISHSTPRTASKDIENAREKYRHLTHTHNQKEKGNSAYFLLHDSLPDLLFGRLRVEAMNMFAFHSF